MANFYPAILANLCENVEVIPAVNQVELHPFFVQEDALENMKAYGVVPQAWGPLAEGKHGIFTDPGAHPNRQKIRQERGPGGASLERPARRLHYPQVGPYGADGGEYQYLDFALTDEEMKQIASKIWGTVKL